MKVKSIVRILSSQGFGSRRDCVRMVRKGLVLAAGQEVPHAKAEYDPEGLELLVDGVHWQVCDQVTLALYKPAGYECSRNPQHHDSVFSLLPEFLTRRGVQPVGRLDADTTGLLILTDDGALNHRLSSPKHRVTKTYQATVKHSVDESFAETLLAGVTLRGDDEPTRALRARVTGAKSLELTIDQGKYHQVKRMIAAASNRCEGLHRVAIGDLQLSALELDEGQWCTLDKRWRAAVDPVS